MLRRVLVVPQDRGEMTVQALIHEMGGFPHSEARGLVDAGCVEVRGAIVDDSALRLPRGARLFLNYDPHIRYKPRPRPRPGEGFRVLYEDADIIVVEKDAGLLSVPTPDADLPSLADRLFASLVERGLKKPQLYAVHRLDRQVSGLLVFARSFESLWGLVPQFDTHVARRSYVCIAEGVLDKSSGTVRSRLSEDARSRRVRVDPEEGRPAITHWTVIERFRDATLCRADLETGRKNQIRVQFAALGHPLLGDERYGRPSLLLARVALHAEHLEFEHPVHGGRVTFRSRVPRDLMHVIHHLRSRGAIGDEHLIPLPREVEEEMRRREEAAAQGGSEETEEVKAEAIATAEPTRGQGRSSGETRWARRHESAGSRPRDADSKNRAARKRTDGKGGGERTGRDILRGRWTKGARKGGKDSPAAASSRTLERRGGEAAGQRARPPRHEGARSKGGRPPVRGKTGPGGKPRRERRPDERRPREGPPVERRPKETRSEEPRDKAGSSDKPGRAPKAAWLRKREHTREDPSIPDWVKAKMGLRPGKSKRRK